MSRYILCAAIWVNDGQIYVHQPINISSGIVVCGRRHHNCFATLFNTKEHYKKFKMIQGFLTNDDMFLTREEAAKVAFEANQIIKKTAIQPTTLMSEDLY